MAARPVQTPVAVDSWVATPHLAVVVPWAAHLLPVRHPVVDSWAATHSVAVPSVAHPARAGPMAWAGRLPEPLKQQA